MLLLAPAVGGWMGRLDSNGVNGSNGTLEKNRDTMERFLDKLAKCGNISTACKAAGVPRQNVYRWREKFTTFRDAWDEAVAEAVDGLEKEAWKRATKGKSNQLLMFLLRAHRPSMYRDRSSVEVSGPEGGAIPIKTYVGVSPDDWDEETEDETTGDV